MIKKQKPKLKETCIKPIKSDSIAIKQNESEIYEGILKTIRRDTVLEVIGDSVIMIQRSRSEEILIRLKYIESKRSYLLNFEILIK